MLLVQHADNPFPIAEEGEVIIPREGIDCLHCTFRCAVGRAMLDSLTQGAIRHQVATLDNTLQALRERVVPGLRKPTTAEAGDGGIGWILATFKDKAFGFTDR